MNRASLTGSSFVVLAGVAFGLAAWIWEGQEATNMFVSSPTGDPLVLLPGLGSALLFTAAPFLWQGSKRSKLSVPTVREVAVVVPIGVLLASLSGLFQTGAFFTPAAVWWYNYGFPLAWRVQVMNGCPPWCNLPSSETIYDPLAFGVDVLFFLALGYFVVLARKWISVRRGSS